MNMLTIQDTGHQNISLTAYYGREAASHQHAYMYQSVHAENVARLHHEVQWAVEQTTIIANWDYAEQRDSTGTMGYDWKALEGLPYSLTPAYTAVAGNSIPCEEGLALPASFWLTYCNQSRISYEVHVHGAFYRLPMLAIATLEQERTLQIGGKRAPYVTKIVPAAGVPSMLIVYMHQLEYGIVTHAEDTEWRHALYVRRLEL